MDEYLMAKFQEDLVPVNKRAQIRYGKDGLLRRQVQEGLTLKFPIPQVTIERIIERVGPQQGPGGPVRPSGSGGSGSYVNSGGSGSSGSGGSGSGSGESGSGESGSGSGSGGSGESGSGSGSGPPASGSGSGSSGSGGSGSGSGGSGSGPFDCETDPRCPLPLSGSGDCFYKGVFCPEIHVVDETAYILCKCNGLTSACSCFHCAHPDSSRVCSGYFFPFACIDCCYEDFGVVRTAIDGEPVLCEMPDDVNQQIAMCEEWGNNHPEFDPLRREPDDGRWLCTSPNSPEPTEDFCERTCDEGHEQGVS